MTSRAPEQSTAAGSGLTQPAPASHPMANEQVTAAYRFKVGGFECTVVSDGPLKLGTFSPELFRGFTQERIDEILAANFLDKGNFEVEQNALVVNTGDKLVLIDTGMGFRKVYGPRSGRLLANLRAAGIDSASIDVVALSHAHPDHVWGLVDEDGKPNFPNAQIYITEADFDYWTDEAKLSDPALGHFIVLGIWGSQPSRQHSGRSVRPAALQTTKFSLIFNGNPATQCSPHPALPVFPANREFYREFRKIVASGAAETPIRAHVTGLSTQFPYSTKQGIISADQGISSARTGNLICRN